MSRRIGAVLGAVALVICGLACQSSGPPVVTGTGNTNEPGTGAYPAPTPEWTTPRPAPAPTLPPRGILPTPSPK